MDALLGERLMRSFMFLGYLSISEEVFHPDPSSLLCFFVRRYLLFKH